jgi:hypothetical protein
MQIFFSVTEDHHDGLLTLPKSKILRRETFVRSAAVISGRSPPVCVSLPSARRRILTLLAQFHCHQQPIQLDHLWLIKSTNNVNTSIQPLRWNHVGLVS